jgi:hypothetical protein
MDRAAIHPGGGAVTAQSPRAHAPPAPGHPHTRERTRAHAHTREQPRAPTLQKNPTDHLRGVCVCTIPAHHRGSCVMCRGEL